VPIERSIMLFNGKGGVAKTSIAANLSGLVALGDWRVLVVDLDKQRNMARDLGCMAASDDGEGLLRAAISGVPGSPMPVGFSFEGTMCTSTSGISLMRSTR